MNALCNLLFYLLPHFIVTVNEKYILIVKSRLVGSWNAYLSVSGSSQQSDEGLGTAGWLQHFPPETT